MAKEQAVFTVLGPFCAAAAGASGPCRLPGRAATNIRVPDPDGSARSLRPSNDGRTAGADPLDVDPVRLLDRTVSDVLAATPAAVRVFIHYRMDCVGCAFAPFETVAEVARAYGIDAVALATRLAEAGRGSAASKELR